MVDLVFVAVAVCSVQSECCHAWRTTGEAPLQAGNKRVLTLTVCYARANGMHEGIK